MAGVRGISWKKLTVSKEQAAGFLLPLILAVCFNLYSQNKHQDSYGKLDDFGRETMATIIKKRIVRYGSDRPGHYYEMTVGFTVGEKMIRGPVQVTGGFYKNHVESDRIPIRYLPDNPKIRELDPAMRSQSSNRTYTINSLEHSLMCNYLTDWFFRNGSFFVQEVLAQDQNRLHTSAGIYPVF